MTEYIITSEQMNDLYGALIDFDTKDFQEIMAAIRKRPIDVETPFGTVRRIGDLK